MTFCFAWLIRNARHARTSRGEYPKNQYVILNLFQNPIIKVAAILSRFATPRTNQMGYRNKFARRRGKSFYFQITLQIPHRWIC